MANRNGSAWPDGFSLSYAPRIPGMGVVGIGGAYYWNPGAPDAPHLTFTGSYGNGKGYPIWPSPWADANAGIVFLRNGMTSKDTLGLGTSSNVSTGLPSVSVNSSIPVIDGIPRPDKARISSIEAGISGSIGSTHTTTQTVTPQQLMDAAANAVVSPAMGPDDELPPVVRSLRTGQGTVATPADPSIRYVSRRSDFGDGMSPWNESAGAGDAAAVVPSPGSANALPPSAFAAGAAPAPYLPQAKPGLVLGLPGLIAAATGVDDAGRNAPPPGGLLQLLQDYRRSIPAGDIPALDLR